MDFNDSPEEAAFRAEARAFLEAHCARKRFGAAKVGEETPEAYLARAKAYQRAKAQAGLAGLTWPSEHGGRGLSPIFHVIFAQEESQFEAPAAPFAIGLGMCLPTVLMFASEADKRRYAPPALRGEEIWCQLFSEPAAGSDVAGIRTRAVRDGDSWIVNGQKVWTSGAHFADYGLLLARTDVDQPKHKGLTMFFLDMRSAGVEVRPIHQASGDRQFNEVFFTDVRVPDSQRLGGEGQGWTAALVTLMNERLAVGGAPGPDYREAIELAQALEAPSGRGSLWDDPGFRRRVADWYVSAEGYALGRYRTMTALSRGATPGPEASIGKLLNANRLQEVCGAALELQGPQGLVSEQDSRWQAFQRGYLWAAGLRIAGGTDEILKNIIAERVMGLPAEPRADKDTPFKELPTGV